MSMHSENGYSDVLRSAWKRYTELDMNSKQLQNRFINARRWIAILGVIATLLALVTDQYSDQLAPPIANLLRYMLIAVPIIISVLSAFANKFIGSTDWLILRAAAEEVLKEIYLYRTVYQKNPNRDEYLTKRLTTILRRTYKGLGGKLIIEPYKGKLPRDYDPKNPYSDPGFNDLDCDQYLSYRLIDQRNWHRNRITQLQRERMRIQLGILLMGGFGAFLAALGGPFVTWVALTAAIASALTGWEELRNLERTIVIYSRVILELTILRDEWESIPPEERTDEAFYSLVTQAESVLWNQNQQYVSSMQESIASVEGDDKELIDKMNAEAFGLVDDFQKKLWERSTQVVTKTRERLDEVVEEAAGLVDGVVDSVADKAEELKDKAETTLNKVGLPSDVVEESVETGTTAAAEETAAWQPETDQAVEIATEGIEAVEELEMIEAGLEVGATDAGEAEVVPVSETPAVEDAQASDTGAGVG